MSIKAGLSFACIKIQRGADNLHDVILEGTPNEGKLLRTEKRNRPRILGFIDGGRIFQIDNKGAMCPWAALPEYDITEPKHRWFFSTDE